MPAVTNVDRDDIEGAAAALRADGVVIVRDVFSAALTERFRQDVRPELDKQEPGGDAFYGKRSKRLGALFRLSDTVAEIVVDPTLLGVVGAVLNPNCFNFRLSLTAVIENYSGGEPQPLHRDGEIYAPFLENDLGDVLVVRTSHAWESRSATPSGGSDRKKRCSWPFHPKKRDGFQRRCSTFWVTGRTDRSSDGRPATSRPPSMDTPARWRRSPPICSSDDAPFVECDPSDGLRLSLGDP